MESTRGPRYAPSGDTDGSRNHENLIPSPSPSPPPRVYRPAICLIRFDREVTRCCDGALDVVLSLGPRSFDREFYPTPPVPRRVSSFSHRSLRHLLLSRSLSLPRTPRRCCKSIYFLIIGQPLSFFVVVSPSQGYESAVFVHEYARSGIRSGLSATCSCATAEPFPSSGAAPLPT